MSGTQLAFVLVKEPLSLSRLAGRRCKECWALQWEVSTGEGCEIRDRRRTKDAFPRVLRQRSEGTSTEK